MVLKVQTDHQHQQFNDFMNNIAFSKTNEEEHFTS